MAEIICPLFQMQGRWQLGFHICPLLTLRSPTPLYSSDVPSDIPQEADDVLILEKGSAATIDTVDKETLAIALHKKALRFHLNEEGEWDGGYVTPSPLLAEG
mmetsp:Transcript_4110/g.8030  ORF Transcript_4110/g.8030 Transcript_4110/m.8030 type:complete len:102 (+) Transcript_4110:47-352(+)